MARPTSTDLLLRHRHSTRLALALLVALGPFGCAHGAAPAPSTVAVRPSSTLAAQTPRSPDEPPGLRRLDGLPGVDDRGGCGALDRFEPTVRASVLGDRFSVPMSQDVRAAEERPAGQPGDLRRDSIVYVERGSIQLTVLAHETLSLPGDDLLAHALATEASAVPFGIVAPARLGGELDAVVVESTDPHPRTGNVLVARAYVVSLEATVSLFEFFVTSVAEPMVPQQCRSLVRRLITGIAAGQGRIHLGGGSHAIGSLLHVDVPAGYAVEDRSTPASTEVVFERVHPLGQLPPALTVSVTLHPPNIALPRDRSGPYLGRTVSWRNLYGSDIERRSAILRIPGHEEYAFSIAEAPTIEEVSALMELAGRIHVQR